MNDLAFVHRSSFIVHRLGCPNVSVEDLRNQLRDRGYLTHGIERWFALDPWSSRAFWLELITVCAKAAVLIGAFGLLPFVTVMLFRNRPLTGWETLALAIVYGGAICVAAFALLALTALLLKLRPALIIDTPRALLAISFLISAIFAAPLAIWWYRFDAQPSLPELLTGLPLTILWFLVTTIAVSAALLSFSIYEQHRVPAIHQRSRTVPMTMAASILTALLFLPAYAAQEKRPGEPPLQIVTTPSARRIALIAVDGLTADLLRARSDLTASFDVVEPLAPLAGGSTAERWATVGTGVPPRVHGVHAVEGVRLPGGRHLLQNVSSVDTLIRHAGRREPLPPTVRLREYIWEIFARRSMLTLSVNWWTTDDVRSGALSEVGQASIFSAAAGDAVAIDTGAASRLLSAIDRDKPQFVTVYLPALDVLLNRQQLDQTARLAGSVRALDALHKTINAVRARGYDIVVIGLPGDHQAGTPVLASTIHFSANHATPYDIAPTLASLLGFPASAEMQGKSMVAEEQQRIATYGARASRNEHVKVNEEYYENLRSLGYIR
jgi:hypothetical protein